MWVGGLRRPIRPSFEILLFKFCFSFVLEHWRFCSMMVVLKFNFVFRFISIDQFKSFILQLKTEKSLLYFCREPGYSSQKGHVCVEIWKIVWVSGFFFQTFFLFFLTKYFLSCFNRSIFGMRRYVVPRLCS